MNQLHKTRGLIFKAACAATFVLAASSASVIADVLNPNIGDVIFEEQFNTLNPDLWNKISGGGGYGNQELQNYQEKNLTIEDVPGEPGNKALVITAKREKMGNNEFTSGKFESQNKLTVQYGLIEARIRIPKVEGGLWPAFWALGNNREGWPRKGEIDLLEMGYPNNAAPQYPNSNSNNFVTANTFHYMEAACNAQNPTCAANRNWQPTTRPDGTPIPPDQLEKKGGAVVPSMSDRFAIYRFYWTPTEMRMTVSLDGIEHDMWRKIDISDASSAAFRQPYFIIFNMAVGGTLPGILKPEGVTADLSNAKMYIDYLRVSRLDGFGTVKQGVLDVNPGYAPLLGPKSGVLGVYTDNTPTTEKLDLGVNADFFIWENTLQAGTEPAYEGTNVLSLSKNNIGWFGASINPRLPIDLSRFSADGKLKFKIKAPANLEFKIGIRDNYTNANSVTFPANTTRYGLVRDGKWGEVSIPMADLRGPLVAPQALTGLLEITGATTATTTLPLNIAIDDIVYDCGNGPECAQAKSSSSSSKSSVATTSSKSSVATTSSSNSSRSSAVATSSSSKSSVVATSSSSKSSVVATSSSSKSSAVATSSSSSAIANAYGHKINSATSVTFTITNGLWADVHYTVNGAPINVRMLHNADNSNTFTATNLPAGATITYSFTVGRATGGAYDTPTSSFSLTAYGFTRLTPISDVQPTIVPVVFYTTDSTWSDLHYRINNGPDINVRMVHDTNNTNTFSVQAPYGATITYSFTIGRASGGAMDTPTSAMTNIGQGAYGG